MTILESLNISDLKEEPQNGKTCLLHTPDPYMGEFPQIRVGPLSRII